MAETLIDFVWHYAPILSAPQHKTDATKIVSAHDLPPTLMMGVRDDASFRQSGQHFSIEYCNDGESVATLTYRDGRVTLTERWKGIDCSYVTAPTSNLAEIVRFYLPQARWDEWFGPEIAALGNFHYIPFRGEETTMVSFPDGLGVNIIFPVSASRLADLNDLYVALDARLGRPLQVIATSYLGMAPVNYLQQREPTQAEALDIPHQIFWESMTRLRVPQRPWPKVESAGEEGNQSWAVTDYRIAYIHVCQVVLRDVVPVCTQLVQNGFVASFRREEVGAGREDLFWGSGAYRACVCPSATSLGLIQFDSLVPGMRMTYDKPGAEFLRIVTARNLPSHVTAHTLASWHLDAEKAADVAVANADKMADWLRAEWAKMDGKQI